jgi:hypothetical protein
MARPPPESFEFIVGPPDARGYRPSRIVYTEPAGGRVTTVVFNMGIKVTKQDGRWQLLDEVENGVRGGLAFVLIDGPYEQLAQGMSSSRIKFLSSFSGKNPSPPPVVTGVPPIPISRHEARNTPGKVSYTVTPSDELVRSINAFLESKRGGRRLTESMKLVTPPTPEELRAEHRASAQGLAEVSAMSGSLARPGASNAANPGAGDGSAAPPVRLNQDVVGNVANFLGLKTKKGGKRRGSRRMKTRSTRRRKNKV